MSMYIFMKDQLSFCQIIYWLSAPDIVYESNRISGSVPVHSFYLHRTYTYTEPTAPFQHSNMEREHKYK